MSNPSCKEGALYILHEYINVNLIQPAKIVNDIKNLISLLVYKRGEHYLI